MSVIYTRVYHAKFGYATKNGGSLRRLAFGGLTGHKLGIRVGTIDGGKGRDEWATERAG